MRLYSKRIRDTRLTDRLRLLVAKKYLDWAEMLPDFNGGFIANLQEMRKHQRERSRSCFDRSRPPEGLKFSYSRCVLMEFFPLEEFQSMDTAIRKLFPERMIGYDNLDDFRMQATDLSSFGDHHVGILARKKQFFARPVAILDDLPPEARYISVWVHKVLPSAFVLSFDVVLDEKVTNGLRRLYDRMYLSPVRFRKWLPLRLFEGARSEGCPEQAMEEAVFDWLGEVRLRIEALLRHHFCGYFSRRFHGKGPRLPAIEFFDLEGVSGEAEEFKAWLEKSCGWGEALGIYRPVIEFNGYKDNDLIFVLSERSRSETPDAHRMLFLGGVSQKEEDREQRQALLVDGILRSVLPFVVFLEFLTRIRRTMETLRLRVYRRLAQQRFFAAFGFRKDIGLHSQLQRGSLLLSRFAVEFGHNEEFLKRAFSELQSFNPIAGRPRFQNLRETFFAVIGYHIATLQTHVELVSKSFIEHLSARNMDLTYRLQWRMYAWTVTATMAAVLALLANWSAITNIFKAVVGMLSR